MNKLLELFLTFSKIGAFTFGGGYAMISLIEDNCVEKKKWITHDEMMDITVIAESTPGPIAINCATFVGHKIAGLAGAFCATLGVVLPSFLIIFVISSFLDNFLEIEIIAKAFYGIKVAVGVLILDAGIKMFKKMSKKIFPRVIMALSCITMFFVQMFAIKFSAISLMLIAGAVGLVAFLIQGRKKEESVE
ncbi:MAG: chromate transporter [Agathobacter sp.]|nr:chromate transporter [Agathobacter sp.]